VSGTELVVAIQEERLNRYKRAKLDGASESMAIRYCLDEAGITAGELAGAVYSAPADGRCHDLRMNRALGLAEHGVPVTQVSHHVAHAVGAFATSGFEEAAILVVDGAGSLSTDFSADEAKVVLGATGGGPSYEHASLYYGKGTSIVPLEKHVTELSARRGPPSAGGLTPWFSLGDIFACASMQIFGDGSEPGKVMGLAPYGSPSIPARAFFEIEGGTFRFVHDPCGEFDFVDRWPKREAEYTRLAASAQAALEEAVLYLVRRLRAKCPVERLCYAGGVALNGIVNERILREGGFREVYIMPAAEDSGTAVGAAYYGAWQATGARSFARLDVDAVGRRYDATEIESAIDRNPAIEPRPCDDVLEETADLLCAGKIVGWFSGRSELGPRALGQRSILCDPRRQEMKDHLNANVKRREAFRPFAPIVLLEEARAWFDLPAEVDEASPFMLRVCKVRPDQRERIPAVVHVDGTGRLQTVSARDNPRLHDLLCRFRARTGVPVLLNTSFNVAGEPIVETPDDALVCLLVAGVDACVLEDRVVTKAAAYRSLLDLVPEISELDSIAVERHRPGRSIGRSDLFAGRGDAPLWRERYGYTRHRLPFPLMSSAEGFAAFKGFAGTLVKLRVATKYGLVTYVADLDSFRILEHIDGRSNGWALIDKLGVDERTLIETLSALRRAQVIAFRASRSTG
jgi:carbamoyltransferase